MSISSYNIVKRVNNKRKSIKPLYSDVVFHGDHSQSMTSMGNSLIIGSGDFIKKYQKLVIDENIDIQLIYGVFSNIYKEIYNGSVSNITDEDIEKCKKSMIPYGSTNFYDTTIEQLIKQGTRIEENYNKLNKKVKNLIPLNKFSSNVFAIVTDGMDNLSVEYNSINLKETILKHKKKYGTKIIFMAANISALHVGNEFGLNPTECLQMGSDSYYSFEAMNCLTKYCISRSSSIEEDLKITPLMRKHSCNIHDLNISDTNFDNNQIPIKFSLSRPTLSRVITSGLSLPSINFDITGKY